MRTAENHSQGQAAENLNQQAGENRNAWLNLNKNLLNAHFNARRALNER